MTRATVLVLLACVALAVRATASSGRPDERPPDAHEVPVPGATGASSRGRPDEVSGQGRRSASIPPGPAWTALVVVVGIGGGWLVGLAAAALVPSMSLVWFPGPVVGALGDWSPSGTGACAAARS